MKIRYWIPPGLLDYLKLLRSKAKHRDCSINTPWIHPNTTLGANCMVGRNVEIGPRVRIGDYSYVNAGTVIASGDIGSFVSIGYNCQIGMPEHPTRFLSTSPRVYGRRNVFGIPEAWEDYPSPPVIGADVWVGSNAVILQGVEIGTGAVVAAGAVVTKNVAPFAIVGGVPARQIKYRFSPSQISAANQLRWWEMGKEEIMLLESVFSAGDQWMEALDRLGISPSSQEQDI